MADGQLLNLPNAVTAAGFLAGLYWVAGGPPAAAVASIAADELDGYLARSRGEQTEFGSLFDWTTDVVLTALVLQRLEFDAAIAPTVAVQTYLRQTGYRPTYGSIRAALMAYAVITGQ